MTLYSVEECMYAALTALSAECKLGNVDCPKCAAVLLENGAPASGVHVCNVCSHVFEGAEVSANPLAELRPYL